MRMGDNSLYLNLFSICFVFILTTCFLSDTVSSFVIENKELGWILEFRQLTTSQDYDGCPVWNPKGTKIAYVNGLDYTAGGHGRSLWIMNSNGSDKTKSLDSGGINIGYPDWSPDGLRIMYVKDIVGGGGGIWTINTNGSENTRHTFNTQYEHCLLYTSPSPRY